MSRETGGFVNSAVIDFFCSMEIVPAKAGNSSASSFVNHIVMVGDYAGVLCNVTRSIDVTSALL